MKILIALTLTAMMLLSTALAQQPSKNPVTQNVQTQSGDSPSTSHAATKAGATATEDKVYRIKVEALPPDKPQPPSILAICALFVSALSLVTSLYFSWAARDHNRRSVRPLPYIRQPDYEDHLAVVVQNHGIGPLILQQAKVTRSDGTPGHLIDLIPTPPAGKYFKNFTKVEQVRAIRPGDELALMEIEIDLENQAEVSYRDELRRALGQLTLTLKYTDIYESHFQPYSRTMVWFLRHFKAGPNGA